MQAAQFELLAKMARRFQHFHQNSNTGRIDVIDIAEVYFESLTIRLAKHAEKRGSKLRGRVDSNPAREAGPGLLTLLLASYLKIAFAG
jgi:hypothetical protein